MRSVVLSIVILEAFCLVLHARGKSEAKPEINGPSEAVLKRIANSGENEWIEIVRQLEKEHLALEGRLLRELNAATDKDKKCAFVYLIGRYRLEGKVQELAKIIDLESKPRLNPAEFFWDQYPVVEALIRIGRPAIPAMLENIKAAKGEKITELSVKVIRYVETLPIAKMILQEAIDEEKDPTKKTELRNSLKYLK